MNFDNVRIVLVETSHPGNIGAAARAMKNMGLENLSLVRPNRFPGEVSTARASGATDVLERAQVCDGLDEALAGCRLVLGSSARRRGIGSPEIDPRQAAEQVARASAQAPVAVVFGRERTGLFNDELDRCQWLVRIPTVAGFSSLNVAAAVQVVAYELRMHALLSGALAPPEPPEEAGGHTLEAPAPAEEMERFYDHLQSVLLETGFLSRDNPRHLMRRLRRLFNRTRPDLREVNILRGILSSFERGRQPPGA